jgi:hypothetical protein
MPNGRIVSVNTLSETGCVRERLRPREAASERGCVRERLRPREAASERGCVRERLRIEHRIEALLFTQGIRNRPSLRSRERDVAELGTGDGRALPSLLRVELNRLRRRLVLALELIREVR